LGHVRGRVIMFDESVGVSIAWLGILASQCRLKTMTLVSMYVLDRWSFGFRDAQAGMSAG
jgi:hypothetical protein